MNNDILTNMEMHGLAYICYAIGLNLAEYDSDFQGDAIDNEWEDRVLPWAIEFYASPEYKDNINDEPFIDALNRFTFKKLNEGKEKKMDNYVIMYSLEDGTEGEYTCAAVNRFMAWDQFEDFVKETGLEVYSADCCKITDNSEED